MYTIKEIVSYKYDTPFCNRADYNVVLTAQGEQVEMSNVDKRGKLTEQPFDFQLTKDGKVLIYWSGKIITTLSGAAAQKLAAQLDSADEATVQLVLAKATGNFKHGNERRNKH